MALRRRSLMPPGNPNTSANMSITMDEVDEEAERRGRVQVQRRQSFAILKPSTSSIEDVPLTTSGYSAAQLAEHYANCMKLSAENKINVKNAFNLHIIDYMAEMVRKKSSGLDNLQAASCALDASAKIYGYRVDGLHTDTLKLAGGVLESAKEIDALEKPEDNADQQGGEGPKKTRKKRTNATTIEKNLNNINIANFDLEFDVDPLFKEISSQFDSSNGGRFLCSLYTRDDSCELLIDSKDVQFSAEKQPVKLPKNKNFTWPSAFKSKMEDALVICPPTAHFRFNGWSPDNEDSLDESYMDFQKRSQPTADPEVDEDHVFDKNAPILDDDDDFGGGFVGADDGSDNEGGDEVILDEKRDHLRGGVEKTFRGVGFTDVENLKQHLSFVPSEYSYFDSGKLMLWAGPQHWKFRQTRLPATEAVPGNTAEKRPKSSNKAKELVPYDFMKLLTNENLTETLTLDQIVKAMSVPKTSVKLSSKTMESWSEDKLLLPENLHYSGKDFGLLYHCDFHLPTRPSKQVQVDDSVADYNPENPNDILNFCPENGYDDDHEPMGDDFMSQSVRGDMNHSLVVAPNRVGKLDIIYAKRAKKMDMKRLKAIEWELLNPKLGVFNTDASKNGSAIEEDNLEEEKDFKTDKVSFKSLYKNMHESKMMPPTMVENLTVHLAFVALLHLCNENSLQLKQDGLSNFEIFKL